METRKYIYKAHFNKMVYIRMWSCCNRNMAWWLYGKMGNVLVLCLVDHLFGWSTLMLKKIYIILIKITIKCPLLHVAACELWYSLNVLCFNYVVMTGCRRVTSLWYLSCLKLARCVIQVLESASKSGDSASPGFRQCF